MSSNYITRGASPSGSWSKQQAETYLALVSLDEKIFRDSSIFNRVLEDVDELKSVVEKVRKSIIVEINAFAMRNMISCSEEAGIDKLLLGFKH